MIKKIIACQRLLLNSIPPIGVISKISFSFCICLFLFCINMVLFSGNTATPEVPLFTYFPIISICIINSILYSNAIIFKTIPISRTFYIFNIFLLSMIIVVLLYLAMWIFSVVPVVIILGIIFIVSPESLNDGPVESTIPQIINTTKGDIFMICVLLIILFVGVAITLIKNKKIRISSFGLFAVISYGLLFLLKSKMPISTNSDKIEFIESFSVMPGASTILICVSICTVILCIGSVFISYNNYVKRPS